MAPIHDNLFTALADPERRQILFDLVEKSDSISIDSPPDAVGDGGNVRIERHHVHLPMLDDYGFIDWYPNMKSIEPGPEFEEIRPVLIALANHRETFSTTGL